MKLTAERFLIRLPHPFRIAHGASDSRETILVHLHDEDTGLIGYGEGALPPYYPSGAEACLLWLESGDHALPPPPEAAAAVVALEIARQDLHGRKDGLPLWRFFGGDLGKIPPCARTLSIPVDEIELADRLREGAARGSTHFKLKVGSGDLAWDERIIARAAEILPQAKFSIDANAAWTPAEAAQIAPRLSHLTYIEQPLAKAWPAWEEFRLLIGEQFLPPLIADESIQTLSDLAEASRWAQGINVKLLKAGGLSGAHEWILEARRCHLAVMIGCMVETGIGRTAAAQLAPLADYLDLDPSDTIPMTPMSGIQIAGDRLTLSAESGLGLAPV